MPGGWHPDPYGRAEQRYWDGERWTHHVIRGGTLTTDLDGDPAASSTGNWLDQLGPDAKNRPVPDLLGALSAGGAALVAAGVLVLFAGDDGNRPGVMVGSALLVVAGYLVAMALGRLRPAGVALAAIGAVVFVLAAFAGALSDGEPTAPLLVLAAVTAGMYAAPGLRGRPVLLGIALLSIVGCVTYLAAKSDIDRAGELSSPGVDIGSTTVQSAYAVLLIAGMALLVAAFLLDRALYHGVATVFVAVAVISVVSGAIGVATELGDVGGAILVGLAGLSLAVVGHLGERRFTTWLGAIGVPYALIILVFTIVSDDNRVGGGILLALFGAALVGACLLVPQLQPLRERDSTTTAP